MFVDRDALMFNDKNSISDRVYMNYESYSDSNYEPLNQGEDWRF